jgi:uncharacterized protein (DUF4213/DUF364 family)
MKGKTVKILDDLISALDSDTTIKEIRQGVFHTGVLTRNCGLAATLPKDALKQEPPLIKEPGSLLEKSISALLQMSYSESILEAAIGMATINSLLDVDMESCLELNAAELLAEKGHGKKVAIVGHFPFIPKLRRRAKELWVIEKNPRTGDFSEHEAEDLIPKANVVGITGTAFTNHTLEHLLELCQPGAYVVVLGDTAPLSPILFSYGIDAISSTTVVNPELALRCISEGANFRQIKGTQRLTLLKETFWQK